ncbi:MAG TPA: LysR family transcriptional regulator [Candidatus Acidoferrales bacterium]|nr:LysR family transcriptional regulator [Candidatus Acidoferrales bacterium]
MRDLTALVAVVETGSFTRAAERLHLVQSAVSHAVRRLERELGVALIERHQSGARLTTAGSDLLPHARMVLMAVERTRQEGEAHRGLAKGRVGLGILPTATPLLLARLLRVSRERYPGIQIQVVEDQAATLCERLREGRLDLALVMLPFELGGLAVVELGLARLGLAVALHHPLASRASARLADLAGESWVTWTRTNPGRHWLDETCRIAGIVPHIAREIETVAELKAFVIAGIGVAIIPRAAAVPEAAAGQLALLELEPPVPVTKIAYAFDPDRTGPAVNAVRRVVEEVSRQALQGGPQTAAGD